MENEYKIQFDNISKAFPGVLALDSVSFGIKKGTVHIIMGENGAGKSTLVKIINGSYELTQGKMFIDGKDTVFRDTHEAEKAGIAMIYQELQYIPYFTVERFLMLCREPLWFPGFINWKELNVQAKKMLDSQGLVYDLKARMSDLTVSDIQLLEVIRAICASSAEVIIMDEPTSALSSKEVERLFDNIRMLKQRGLTIIYISHKMDEIFRIADYITVLRDGRHIHTAPAAQLTNESLVKLMVGREISDVYPKGHGEPGEKTLEVRGLCSYSTKIKDVTFYAKRGEILGLGGLMGAGRTETDRAICGLDHIDEGEITINGKKVKIRNVSDAVRNGIMMATEDRRKYGLTLCRSIKENISLASLRLISRMMFVNNKKEQQMTKSLFDRLSIRAPGLATKVETLSGGNQQKVVLSKWLMSDPKIFILDEPTRGIDVGTKFEIYKLMVELANTGMTIIMISSELPEFVGMCDRAYIMHNGTIVDELSHEELSQENVLYIAAGGRKSA